MDDRVTADLLRRLGKLERESVRLRRGTVTDDAPLSVALGGSDIPYTGVANIDGGAAGDEVAALVRGNDLLVLGSLGGAAKIPFPFAAGWGNFGPTHEAASYSKSGRLVVLQGLVEMVSGSSQVIGTLPEGFRPPLEVLFPAVLDPSGGGAGQFGRVNVEPDGDVLVFGTVLDVGDWVSLSGISFIV